MGANRGSASKRAKASKNEADTKASGASRIRSEASRVLKERGQKIAEKLGEKAADGDLKSVELLYRLSREDGEPGDGSAPGCGLAARLATEPEWHSTSEATTEPGPDARGNESSTTDAAQAD